MQSQDQGGENAATMSGELRADAQRLGDAASTRLHSEVDARKGNAAQQVRSVSTAIGKAGNELGDSPQWLQSAFRQGAQRIEQFALTLEQKDSRQILNSVQDLARTNPGAFLAGCTALGFIAARVFKAGSPDPSPPWSPTTRTPPVQGEEPKFRAATNDPASAPFAGEFA